MEQSIKQVIEEIESDPKFIVKIIDVLHQQISIDERYFKLIELLLLPWRLYSDKIKAQQLIFYLIGNYGLDFGACVYYKIEMDENGSKHCDVYGERVVGCLCAIPQGDCVWKGLELEITVVVV